MALRRKHGWLFALLTLLAAKAMAAWPDKPLKIVVPYSAGGTADAVARVIATELGNRLRQPVVVDNRAGAGGTIGAQLVAQAPADGHTLLHDGAAFAVNPFLYSRLSFNYTRDLAPITLVARIPSLLVVPTSSPFQTIADLVGEARKRPGALSYASAGAGGAAHLSAELFRQGFGIALLHVPYKGGAPALADLVGGQVDMMFSAVATSAPLVTAGKLKALATGFDRRLEAWPRIPTVAEAGLTGFSAYEWNAMFAPAGTPVAVTRKLEAEMAAVLGTPAVRERLTQLGAIPAITGASALGVFVRGESAKWAGVIKSAGISVE